MGYNSVPFSLVTVVRLEFLDADKGQYIRKRSTTQRLRTNQRPHITRPGKQIIKLSFTCGKSPGEDSEQMKNVLLQVQTVGLGRFHNRV